MHTAALIASALRKTGEAEKFDGPSGICCLTGTDGPSIPRKTLFGKSFTAQNLFQAPDSDRVSVDAAIALSYKWERMSCWFVTENEFRRIEKKSARSIILNKEYPNGYWAAYITTGYKKHGALTTPVNYGNKRVIWGFDEQNVNLSDDAEFRSMYDTLMDAKRSGLPQTVLETLEADPRLIDQFGVRRWIDLKKRYEVCRLSNLYRFVLYLLPSKEELSK